MLSSAADSPMDQHCQCMHIIASDCVVKKQPVPPLSSLAMLPVSFTSQWPTMSINVTSLKHIMHSLLRLCKRSHPKICCWAGTSKNA